MNSRTKVHVSRHGSVLINNGRAAAAAAPAAAAATKVPSSPLTRLRPSPTILSAVPAFMWKMPLPLRTSAEYPGTKMGDVALDPAEGPWVVTGAVEKLVEWAGVYQQRESLVTFLQLEVVHNGEIVRGWVHQTVPRTGKALLALRSMNSPSRSAAIGALAAERRRSPARSPGHSPGRSALRSPSSLARSGGDGGEDRYPDLVAALHLKRQAMAREVLRMEEEKEARRDADRAETRRVMAALREEIATLRKSKVEILVAHQTSERAHAVAEAALRATVAERDGHFAALGEARDALAAHQDHHASHRATAEERATAWEVERAMTTEQHDALVRAAEEKHARTEEHLASSLEQLAAAQAVVASVRQPLVDAVERHRAARDELGSLRVEKNAELAAQAAEVAALRAELSAESERADEAEARAAALEDTVGQLNAELDDTEAVAKRAVLATQKASLLAARSLVAEEHAVLASAASVPVPLSSEDGDARTPAREGATPLVPEVPIDPEAAAAVAAEQIAEHHRELAQECEALRATIAGNSASLAGSSTMLESVATAGSAQSVKLAWQLDEMSGALDAHPR